MIKKTILFTLALIVLFTFGCNKPKDRKPNEQKSSEVTTQTSAIDEQESDEEKRFYELTKNLQKKYEAGEIEEVNADISEIKVLLPNFISNWNYGNAIHKMNIVAGRIALQTGNVAKAKNYLILAGRIKGSPQLNSFGPNMSLAKELLEKEEKDIVLQYFSLCKVFWKSRSNKLKQWNEQVQKDEMPDFGANMVF